MTTSIRKALDILDGRTRRRLPLLAGTFALLAAFDAVSVGLVFPLMLILVDPQAAEQSEWLATVADILGARDRQSLVIGLGMVIAGCFVAKSVASAFLVRWQYAMVSRAEASVGVRLFIRYLTSPWQAVSQRNSSELIRNASTSASSTFLAFIIPVMTIMVEGLLGIALLAMLLIADAAVALVSLAMVSLAVGLYYIAVRRDLTRIGRQFQEATFGLLNHLKQGIGAAREIRVLGRQGEFVRKLQDSRDLYAAVQTKRVFLTQLPRYYLESVLVIVVLVAVIVALATREPTEVAPLLALFGVAAVRLLTSATRGLAAMQQVRIGTEALAVVHADLVAPAATPPPPMAPGACGLPDAMADPGPSAAPAGIRVQGISFAYRPAEPALIDVDLHIRWGESIGVVGPSGSGKSTLIDIVLGLLPPTRGQVLVDGRNILEMLPQWRSRLGYVPQHIYLTDDTLRRNIAFGLADRDIDDARVRRALQMAHLTAVAEGLPDGLDTVVGEHGASLSGGQRQRIGIARALYHDPDVVLMDEATSALDSETENFVVAAVDALKRQKTIIVVAHRLSTVRRCDRLVMLDGGRMVAAGSFDALARTNADFARIVELGTRGRAAAQEEAR